VKYEGKKALSAWWRRHPRTERMAAQVFTAVRHINVRMIRKGERNQHELYDRRRRRGRAVRSLHAAFFQNPDPAIFDVERESRW